MKILIVPNDHVVLVDGEARPVDLSDLIGEHRCVRFDTDAGAGIEEFLDDVADDVQARDHDAEAAAWAAARAAGTPENEIDVPVMQKTIKVHRRARPFIDFAPFQAALDRWTKAKPNSDRPGPGYSWDTTLGQWVLSQADADEENRLTAFDTAIKAATYGAVQPATLDQLKAMSNAQFSAWFDANVTTAAQAIGLLKLLTRAMVRRVL